MKAEIKGWVIVSEKHPATGRLYISQRSFGLTRKEAIKKFIIGSVNDWNYWKREYNFRAVKATFTIQTITT